MERWILHTAGIPPQVLRDLPETRARLQRVRDFRTRSKRQTTLRLADYPTAYGVTTDAAYDTIGFYEAAGARGATVVVLTCPPWSCQFL